MKNKETQSIMSKALKMLSKVDLTTGHYIHTKDEIQYSFDSEKGRQFLYYFIPFIKTCKNKLSFRNLMKKSLKRASIEEKKWLFMKLKKQIEYENIKNKSINHNIEQCVHPRDKREYIGQNMLLCKICGKLFS